MSQADKSVKKVARGGSAAWGRDRMNETRRKGRRASKKQVRRVRRKLDQTLACDEQ